MKNLFTLLLLLSGFLLFSQEKKLNYKEYSYTQLFKMIEDEKDTIFKLKDAIIRYNSKTDSLLTTVRIPFLDPTPIDTLREPIVIDKQIHLENVLFSKKYKGLDLDKDGVFDYFASGCLTNIHFKKSVIFEKVTGLHLYLNVFDESFSLRNYEFCIENAAFYKQKKIDGGTIIGKNQFKKNVDINSTCKNKEGFALQFYKNTVLTSYAKKRKNHASVYISLSRKPFIILVENKFQGNGNTTIQLNENKDLTISENIFSSPLASLSIKGEHTNLLLQKNQFLNGVRLGINKLIPSDLIDHQQFNKNITSRDAFNNYINLLSDEEYDKTETEPFVRKYRDTLRYQDSNVYAGEAALMGSLYRHYRESFDMVSANKTYMQLKDFETKHLEYQFDANPSFDTYFQWKVNQFLKVFSNYGTKPSKAITFSVYVIFVFALFYLFFPNSWDRHGKNRILDRYSFFLKYMDKKAGIHEVYLEGQKEEILAYDEYKKLIKKSDKKVPRFFTATVLPIYKWSVAGTQISTSFLRKIDIMKGTWSDLPKSKRIWKSTLLISAFLLAILYDVFIKVLNALMLSINTFTTLGFGEIPIKGLPRYLAIVQGFIGWFMLTIFSVSLISQLLN